MGKQLFFYGSGEPETYAFRIISEDTVTKLDKGSDVKASSLKFISPTFLLFLFTVSPMYTHIFDYFLGTVLNDHGVYYPTPNKKEVFPDR